MRTVAVGNAAAAVAAANADDFCSRTAISFASISGDRRCGRGGREREGEQLVYSLVPTEQPADIGAQGSALTGRFSP